MKKVLIGTVSSNAMLSAYYVTSLFNSQKVLAKNNIELCLEIVINEPLIQLARNKLLSVFLESDCDQLIFIDSDQAWDPNDLLKLIESDKDFIGAPVIFKTSNNYNVSFKEAKNDEILEVDSVGTGFLKISRSVAEQVFNSSEEYLDGDMVCKMAFEIKVVNGNVVSEDFVFCKKWKDLGKSIFVDTSINPYHIGNVSFRGNFKEYLSQKYSCNNDNK
jgi:uncharacterized protein YlxP (DUF503 family)